MQDQIPIARLIFGNTNCVNKWALSSATSGCIIRSTDQRELLKHHLQFHFSSSLKAMSHYVVLPEQFTPSLWLVTFNIAFICSLFSHSRYPSPSNALYLYLNQKLPSNTYLECINYIIQFCNNNQKPLDFTNHMLVKQSIENRPKQKVPNFDTKFNQYIEQNLQTISYNQYGCNENKKGNSQIYWSRYKSYNYFARSLTLASSSVSVNVINLESYGNYRFQFEVPNQVNVFFVSR